MSLLSLLKQRATIERRGQPGGTDDYGPLAADVPCYKRDNAGSARGDEVQSGAAAGGKGLADTLISMQTSTDVQVGDRVTIAGQVYDVTAVDDVAAGHHRTVYAKWVPAS
jgi:hypothetical protein